MNQLFSKRALDKRHHLGEQATPVRLLTPPLRFTIGLGVVIAVSGAVWATVTRIPLTVQGTGVLLPVSAINRSVAETDGTTIWMFSQRPAAWHSLARRFSLKPESLSDAQIIALTEQILGDQTGRRAQQKKQHSNESTTRYAEIIKERYRDKILPAGKLLLWIQSSETRERLSSGLEQLQDTLKETTEKASNIRGKQKIIRHELASRSAYLQDMKKLQKKGFVSRSSILQEQAQVDSLRSQILGNTNELIQLDAQQREVIQKLRQALAAFVGDQLIFAPHDVYLSQVIPNDGETVSKGQTVLKLSDEPLNSPVDVPVFLSSREMAEVFPGMPVLATPSGYRRSEVGGIRGRVVSMAQLPSGMEDVSARVGVRSLAEVILQREPAPTLAVIALEQDPMGNVGNRGGYRWSTRTDLPFPPSVADRLEVEVTTRQVRPIELVMPALRRFFGITPPEPEPTDNHRKPRLEKS